MTQQTNHLRLSQRRKDNTYPAPTCRPLVSIRLLARHVLPHRNTRHWREALAQRFLLFPRSSCSSRGWHRRRQRAAAAAAAAERGEERCDDEEPLVMHFAVVLCVCVLPSRPTTTIIRNFSVLFRQRGLVVVHTTTGMAVVLCCAVPGVGDGGGKVKMASGPEKAAVYQAGEGWRSKSRALCVLRGGLYVRPDAGCCENATRVFFLLCFA